MDMKLKALWAIAHNFLFKILNLKSIDVSKLVATIISQFRHILKLNFCLSWSQIRLKNVFLCKFYH